MIFLDTSALLRDLLKGTDGDLIREACATGTEAASTLLFPEARGALARVERAGSLTSSRLRMLVQELETRWREYRLIPLDEATALAAGALAAKYSLSGADAAHLASALSLPREQTTFACTDERLREAARREGLAVLP